MLYFVMTGADLRKAREAKGWTQVQAAKRLRVTQAYLSMLERGRRSLPDDLAANVARLLPVSPITLPLDRNRSSDLAEDLGALGYAGFSYLASRLQRNPASVLLDALSRKVFDARVAEALPWLAFEFAQMNWKWLLPRVKVLDRQNRLGFLVTLARLLAEGKKDADRVRKLTVLESRLEKSRLVAEDNMGSQLTNTETEWLRTTRSAEAKFWNVLSDMRLEHLHVWK